MASLRPSRGPLVVLGLGTAVAALGALIGFAMFLDKELTSDTAVFGFFLCATGPLVGAGVIAALLEGKAKARAVCLGIATAAAAIGALGITGALAMAEDASTALVGGACCFGLPVVGLGGWTAATWLKGKDKIGEAKKLAVKRHAGKCPSCGAALTAVEDQALVCAYCGNELPH